MEYKIYIDDSPNTSFVLYENGLIIFFDEIQNLFEGLAQLCSNFGKMFQEMI